MQGAFGSTGPCFIWEVIYVERGPKDAWIEFS